MKIVLVILSVTFVQLVLCANSPDGSEQDQIRQKKEIANWVTATREFISAVKQIKIERAPTSQGEGRGNHGLMKIAVPLIAGFKAASMVVASLVILKGLLLKSLAFSAIALSVSAGIAFKYLYDKVQGPIAGGGGHSYDPQSIYSAYAAQGWGGGGGSSDQVWQGSSAVEFGQGNDPYSLTASGDLQGHFSEHIQKIANQSRVPFSSAQRKSVPVPTGVKTTVYKTTIKRIDA